MIARFACMTWLRGIWMRWIWSRIAATLRVRLLARTTQPMWGGGRVRSVRAFGRNEIRPLERTLSPDWTRPTGNEAVFPRSPDWTRTTRIGIVMCHRGQIDDVVRGVLLPSRAGPIMRQSERGVASPLLQMRVHQAVALSCEFRPLSCTRCFVVPRPSRDEVKVRHTLG